MRMFLATVAAGLVLALAPVAQGAVTPPLVEAYAKQLALQCGPLPQGAPAPASLIQEVDLNGDKLSDWVVDAGAYPCPSRPAIAVAAGAQLTIFKGIEGGTAVPAFQRAAFGARVTRTPSGAPEVRVTLGGSDCGEPTPAARCERVVVWQGGRFDAVTPPKPAKR